MTLEYVVAESVPVNSDGTDYMPTFDGPKPFEQEQATYGTKKMKALLDNYTRQAYLMEH